MKKFFYNISLRYRILIAYIVIILIFAGIGIIQYNVLIKINKIKEEKTVLITSKFNFLKIQYLFVEELELLQEIKTEDDNDEIDKINNRHQINEQNFDDIFHETKQMLSYESEKEDIRLFLLQLKDTLSNINSNYHATNIRSFNKVVKYKNYLNNPDMIKANYQEFIQEESLLNVN